MLSSRSAPKTLRDLIKALAGLSAQTKVEIFEAETLKNLPPRYLLERKKATVIVLAEFCDGRRGCPRPCPLFQRSSAHNCGYYILTSARYGR